MTRSPEARCQTDDDAGDCGGAGVPFLTEMQGQRVRVREKKQIQFSFIRRNTKTRTSKMRKQAIKIDCRLVSFCLYN